MFLGHLEASKSLIDIALAKGVTVPSLLSSTPSLISCDRNFSSKHINFWPEFKSMRISPSFISINCLTRASTCLWRVCLWCRLIPCKIEFTSWMQWSHYNVNSTYQSDLYKNTAGLTLDDTLPNFLNIHEKPPWLEYGR